jgi:hypothetical protein
MKIPSEISGSDRYIDSRDVEARIDWLEGLLCEEEYRQSNPDEQDELDALLAFREDAGSSEWHYGISFIREDEFEHYAFQLAEDIHGRAIGDAEWPFSCIDWKQAADDLRQDYSEVEFDGESYLYRG